MKHGGKVKYRFCNAPHCSNVTQKGGYCKRHFNILVEGVGVSTSGESGSNKKRRLSEAASMEGCRDEVIMLCDTDTDHSASEKGGKELGTSAVDDVN
eukprot:scaffold14122_cov87-Skeletonema_dohrnii-CCMP3373.AAC.1